jgi:hypothetical protein
MEPTTPTTPASVRGRVIATILSGAALILLIFVAQILVTLEREVTNLRQELATKQDLANLAVHIGPPDPAMAKLEGTCTDCHTKETFQQAHGVTQDAHELVQRMSELSGAHIGKDEIPNVEAALAFMKCAHCHSSDRLKELAILSPKDRWDVIVKMMNEPGTTITQDDAQRIRDFYGEFWGWHTTR